MYIPYVVMRPVEAHTWLDAFMEVICESGLVMAYLAPSSRNFGILGYDRRVGVKMSVVDTHTIGSN